MKSSSFLKVLCVVGLFSSVGFVACNDDDPTPSGQSGSAGRAVGGSSGRGGTGGSGTAGTGTNGSGTSGTSTNGSGTGGMGTNGSNAGGSAGGSGENSDALCKDGIDNDGNSFIDCKDFGCQYFPVTTDACSQAGEANNVDCSDGKDNDGDNRIDCNDFSCSKNPNVTVCANTGGSAGAGGSGGGGGGSGATGGSGGSGATGGSGGSGATGGSGGSGATGGSGGGGPGGKVVINEVVINPPGTDAGCFVELRGTPGDSLAGVIIRSVNGNGGNILAEILLGPSQKLDANGYFVVAQDSTVTLPGGATPFIDSKVDFQNGPDNIVLLAPGGAILDALGYSDQGGLFPIPANVFAGEGTFAIQPAGPNASKSFSRLPNGVDTNNNAADFAPGELTPGAPNTAAINTGGSGGGGGLHPPFLTSPLRTPPASARYDSSSCRRRAGRGRSCPSAISWCC